MQKRTHVVLVPGFGGFDALGELKYYAGITDVFLKWKEARAGRGNDAVGAVLHYYDNLPTASVAVRAKGLRLFLAKLMLRQVIEKSDAIALVGHSTGGLDIRQLLLDLKAPGGPGPLDGQPQATLSNQDILARIHRAAFLSVPQLGTNIADWVQAHGLTFKVLIHLLREAMGLAGILAVVDPMQIALKLLDATGSGLLEAVADVTRDIDLRSSPDRSLQADGRQALHDVDLWLSNVDEDFMAIRDLASARPNDLAFTRLVDVAARGRRWEDDFDKIATRSYATIGRWPFVGDGPPPGDLHKPASPMHLFHVARTDGGPHHPDIVYRIAYEACATGPFASPQPIAARWLKALRPVDKPETYAPRAWENDGVVNTASMLWPNGSDTLLVPGDHADIIGHFAPRLIPGRNDSSKDRHYDAYDLLGSRSGFDKNSLEAVWTDVFDFVAGDSTSA